MLLSVPRKPSPQRARLGPLFRAALQSCSFSPRCGNGPQARPRAVTIPATGGVIPALLTAAVALTTITATTSGSSSRHRSCHPPGAPELPPWTPWLPFSLFFPLTSVHKGVALPARHGLLLPAKVLSLRVTLSP